MPSGLIESLECGLDFIEFLGDRVSITDRTELRDIYNSEFKGREGIKDSTFASVIFALLKFNKVTIKQGKVYVNARSQVRVYCDQWRTPRRSPQSSGPQVSAGTPPRASAGTSPIKPVLTPKKKIVTEIVKKLKANRKELTADKGGIEITSDPATSEGKIQFTVEHLRELFTVKFCISNKGTDRIHFTYYTALHRIRCFTLEDECRVTRACPLGLCPGEIYEVKVLYRLSHHGYFPATLYFEFCSELPGSVPFCIVREIEAAASTPLGVELGPVAPYKPLQAVTYKAVKTVIVEGVPPVSTIIQTTTSTKKLGDYKYPVYLKELARQRLEDSEYLSATAGQKLEAVKNLLDSSLEMKNYDRCFDLLLHLEEIQMEVDIRKYDMRNEVMTLDQSNKKLLVLQVPGVAENRPSVLRGDCLRVSKAEDTESPITLYAGYVHRVELDRVKLGFSKRLLQTFINNMKFNVEFTINRFPLKMQHRAVQLAVTNGLGDVLFPTKAANSTVPVPKLSMCNNQLENNPEQFAAVQRIVAGSSKPAPHLVFGPPGTGKTITLVEAMNQVSRAHSGAHILACAPSNSACDLLCERLLVHMDVGQVYRLYASSRDPNTVPKQFLKHSNWDEKQDAFMYPDKNIVMKYTIAVTTMVTAGRLVSVGIPVGHFSYIFVDEGGQAVEPESVIAIAGLLSPGDGQLVLAGDPKQLGPILRSPLALQYGLGTSLLERLMTQNELYQKTSDSGHFDTRFVTKLLRNYRSHAAILKIPNELFYENELQVFADPWERENYCNWEHLPRKGFPIIFHGVLGKDEREANSPSFFNVSEIEVLMDYLVKLIKTQGKKNLPKLTAKDIGIISPYRKQVEKILKALKSVKAVSQWSDIKDLKVGSVEEFQGQERKIIMVSTVRSSINYVKMDKDFNIGFLSNEKRFNVAITRARSLLIVVGNPVILNKDPTWNKFISYCVNEKGYTGFDFNDAEGEDDVVSRLANLKICAEADDVLGEESAQQQFVDPELKN
ncbi:putative helicase mov-10-B.1 [Eucyclogobius newberryi]|uniref:putative helicase mov-10-B.1 n=1 Tax=Eucyclogobius newberryi TaxID=166745 RepID=UPI003B5CB594